jgi:hypothetical protein
MDILTIILAKEVLLLKKQDAHRNEINYLSKESLITTAVTVIILDMAIQVIQEDQDMDILVIQAILVVANQAMVILVVAIQAMVILVITYPKIFV